MEPKQEIIQGEIVPFDTHIAPNTMRAIQAIETGKIPSDQISSHPGKGGKIFKYVKHTHATKLMHDGFGQSWDWEVLNPQIYSDGSASVLGKMTLHLPYKDDDGKSQIYVRVIQEIGAFEPVGGTMPMAMRVSSAASRALLKCMFRAFGFGKELYPDMDEEISPKTAWNTLLQYAVKNKIAQADLMARFRKEKIFTSEGKLTEEEQSYFVTKFEEMWKIVREMAEEKRGLVAVPVE
jgi:hypothetical protein